MSSSVSNDKFAYDLFGAPDDLSDDEKSDSSVDSIADSVFACAELAAQHDQSSSSSSRKRRIMLFVDDQNIERVTKRVFRGPEDSSQLIAAIEDRECQQCIEALERGCDPSVRSRDSGSVLELGIEENNLELINKALESGANPIERNSDGETTLHRAIRAKDDVDEKITLALIHASQTVEVLDEEGKSPLDKVLEQGKETLVLRALAERNPTEETMGALLSNGYYETALHLIQAGAPIVMDLSVWKDKKCSDELRLAMIDACEDINEVKYQNHTAFGMSMQYAKTAAPALRCLEKGASVNCLSRFGHLGRAKPLHILRESLKHFFKDGFDYGKVYCALKDKGATASHGKTTILHEACRKEVWDLVDSAIGYGQDPFKVGNNDIKDISSFEIALEKDFSVALKMLEHTHENIIAFVEDEERVSEEVMQKFFAAMPQDSFEGYVLLALQYPKENLRLIPKLINADRRMPSEETVIRTLQGLSVCCHCDMEKLVSSLSLSNRVFWIFLYMMKEGKVGLVDDDSKKIKEFMDGIEVSDWLQLVSLLLKGVSEESKGSLMNLVDVIGKLQKNPSSLSVSELDEIIDEGLRYLKL